MRAVTGSAHMWGMATTTVPKDLRNLVKLAESQGWSYGKTNGGHIKFSAPGCPPVYCASTPSDHRAQKNLIATLRRSGMEIPRSFKP